MPHNHRLHLQSAFERRIGRKHLLAAAIVLLLVAGFSLAQETANRDSSSVAFVRIRVNIDYDDSPQNLRQLKELMDFLKPAKATLRRGETPSAFILRLYGFGPNDRIPNTYKLIENKILSLNNWDKPESADAGECYVPRLPRRRGRRLSPSNPYYSVPATRKLLDFIKTLTAPLWPIDSIESKEITQTNMGMKFTNANSEREANEAYVAIDQLGSRSAELRKSTSFYDMQILITESDLRSAAGQKFLNSPYVDTAVTGADMSLQFATTHRSGQDEEYRLSEEDRDRIHALIVKEPRRPVYVFILDSGWPNAEAYKSSRREIFKMFDLVRQRWKMNPKKRNSKAPEFIEPSNKHCKQIAMALDPFETLDATTNRVRVVYFPISLEQNSREIIEELLELSQIADKMGAALGDGPVPKDTQNDARGYAREVLKSLPTDACAPKVGNVCSPEVHTNKAILEGLWTLGDEIAGAGSARPVYFINQSWTIRKDALKLREPGQPNGIAVVAAGNNGGIVNSDSGRLDFARRCYPASHYLTVLNVKSGKGLQCNSSRVDETKDVLAKTMTVAFDGSIAGSCGTSFAAPRIAWLLALAEAYRLYDVERTHWAPDVQRRLLETRTSAPGFESLILDLEEYLQRSQSIRPNR